MSKYSEAKFLCDLGSAVKDDAASFDGYLWERFMERIAIVYASRGLRTLSKSLFNNGSVPNDFLLNNIIDDCNVYKLAPKSFRLVYENKAHLGVHLDWIRQRFWRRVYTDPSNQRQLQERLDDMRSFILSSAEISAWQTLSFGDDCDPQEMVIDGKEFLIHNTKWSCSGMLRVKGDGTPVYSFWRTVRRISLDEEMQTSEAIEMFSSTRALMKDAWPDVKLSIF